MRADRKGIAIVVALGGIVVIGALIAGVFFVSTQEHQVSGGTLVHERAFRAAELGLNTTLANWDNSAMGALPVGGMATLTYSGQGWVDTVLVTKLTQRSFSILSAATAGSGRLARSRKRTLLSVRLSVPAFDFKSALTVRGQTTITGNSTVSGADANPGTWMNCPVTTDTLAGVAHADPSQVSIGGSSTVTGSPAVLQDPAAGDTANYFNFGDENWASLTAAANKVVTSSGSALKIEPVVTGGACDKSVQTNWGAPARTAPANPCETYLPIIHAKGASLKVNGKTGQGILLVDGDLEIQGNFEFFGPIIVRGRLRLTGTGNKLNGAVMAAHEVELDPNNQVSGNATITYSSCAIKQALAGAASPRRIVQRAWTEVY